jgi:hypothetical protein
MFTEEAILDSAFKLWMEQVDRVVDALSGVSVHDLPDCLYRDWFDDNVHAETAARRALKAAGMLE